MLIFNPNTKKQIDSILVDMPQGVLLTGVAGAGLLATAKYIAGSQLSAIIGPVNKDGDINPVKGTISVKRIRELYDQSRSKSLKRQVFIIDNADRMSAGAQNAFLKLLEEPNPQVVFILTTHATTLLLPTVLSRVEQINILPITNQQSVDLLINYKLSASQQAQALFVAAGKPAELTRMAENNSYFEAKASIMSAAKTFVSGGRVDRLQVAFAYSVDREKSLQLLRSSIAILTFTIKNKPSAEAIMHTKRLADAYDAIAANGNAKLHLVATVL
mgnify:FL=1